MGHGSGQGAGELEIVVDALDLGKDPAGAPLVVEQQIRAAVVGGVVVAVVVAFAPLGAQACADAVGEALARAQCQASGIVRATSKAYIDRGMVGATCDDVQHATHGLITEQYAATALQDLDALDVDERDAAEVGCFHRRVVQSSAIDQHQGVVYRVFTKAAHADNDAAATVTDGVTDLQPGMPLQHLGNVLCAAAGDVIVRDHADRCGRFEGAQFGTQPGDDDLLDAAGGAGVGCGGEAGAQQCKRDKAMVDVHGPSPVPCVMRQGNRARRGDWNEATGGHASPTEPAARLQ